MISEVGTQVLLSKVVRDTSNTPVNSPTLTLLVTKPDGTTASPSVTNTASGGLYTALYTVDQAGDFLLKWTATGTVIGVYSDQLTGVANQRTLVSSLAELKQQLNRSDTIDDAELQTYLYAATEWVESVIGGPLAPTTFTETHTIDSYLIAPRRRPLVSVTSITPYLGSALDPSTYTVDTDSSVIRLRVWWCGQHELSVVYKAGLSTIPERVKLAGLIVAAHLWQTQNNLRGGSARSISNLVGQTEEVMMTGLGFAIPKRAMDLLAPDLIPRVG